jgi:hypothetical protein
MGEHGLKRIPQQEPRATVLGMDATDELFRALPIERLVATDA